MSERRSSWFAFLSLLSGGSLLFCGLASTLVSVAIWSLLGLTVGLVLCVHGAFELRMRRAFLGGETDRASRRLAWNQIALAGSLSGYFGYQFFSIDRSELTAMLYRDPLKSLLELYPPEVASTLVRDLPGYVSIVYGGIWFLVVAGCLGMAIYYRRSGS